MAQRTKAFKGTNPHRHSSQERLPEAPTVTLSPPPTLMIPAASSTKNLLCARPCRNVASLVLTSPDGTVAISQGEHLKFTKVQGLARRHTQLSSWASPWSTSPHCLARAWNDICETPASEDSVHISRLHRRPEELAGENQGGIDSGPSTIAEGVGRAGRGGEQPTPSPPPPPWASKAGA